MIDPERISQLNDKQIKPRGPIIYWMSRDQRFDDNWAMLCARELAARNNRAFAVVFCLSPSFLDAALRQYMFMIKGLKEIEERLKSKNIAFILLQGDPPEQILDFVDKHEAAAVVTDFDPLRIKTVWKRELSKSLSAAFLEVDAHNIVPCRLASSKREYGAYTIRPKIKRFLSKFLTDYPRMRMKHQPWPEKLLSIDWDSIIKHLNVDDGVSEVDWIKSGQKAAIKALQAFIDKGIHGYAENRNDPNKDGQSNLSPYLHFGQLSAQRAAIEVNRSDAAAADKDAFLDELIIRRELADNFCHYEPLYDDVSCFPEWARSTLTVHMQDRREYGYDINKLEKASTHDPLWNASQRQMVIKGKMHGYMRMYWAKKILEWSRSPSEAMKAAVYLNDKYELDGRDPNGYAGIAWSIGGVHDRAWGERDIFGKIRYMSYKGVAGKFDVDKYIEKWMN